jgi:hypothetical protein
MQASNDHIADYEAAAAEGGGDEGLCAGRARVT